MNDQVKADIKIDLINKRKEFNELYKNLSSSGNPVDKQNIETLFNLLQKEIHDSRQMMGESLTEANDEVFKRIDEIQKQADELRNFYVQNPKTEKEIQSNKMIFTKIQKLHDELSRITPTIEDLTGYKETDLVEEVDDVFSGGYEVEGGEGDSALNKADDDLLNRISSGIKNNILWGDDGYIRMLNNAGSAENRNKIYKSLEDTMDKYIDNAINAYNSFKGTNITRDEISDKINSVKTSLLDHVKQNSMFESLTESLVNRFAPNLSNRVKSRW